MPTDPLTTGLNTLAVFLLDLAPRLALGDHPSVRPDLLAVGIDPLAAAARVRELYALAVAADEAAIEAECDLDDARKAAEAARAEADPIVASWGVLLRAATIGADEAGLRHAAGIARALPADRRRFAAVHEALRDIAPRLRLAAPDLPMLSHAACEAEALLTRFDTLAERLVVATVAVTRHRREETRIQIRDELRPLRRRWNAARRRTRGVLLPFSGAPAGMDGTGED